MTSLAHTLPIFAQQTAPASGGMQGLMGLLPIVLMFGAMYFLLIAPQRKKQKQHEKMLSELGEGDEIVTAGGLYATITSVKTDRFVVRIADGTKVELGKGFVSTVVKKA
ncbi:MAG: preprotein translocase subunit YajC [Opitutaceae bacterium]|nr:preprotein translocase subunit YajC [Opitutaceae bacterium]